MSITRIGLGCYPERKKPERLFEPPPIDFLAETEAADAVFTDVPGSPTTPPTTIEGEENTIFTDVIPTSDDDAE